VPSTGVFTFTPADKTNLVNNGKTLQLGTDGTLTLANGTAISDINENLTLIMTQAGPPVNDGLTAQFLDSGASPNKFSQLVRAGLIVNGPGVTNGVVQSVDAAGLTLTITGGVFQTDASYVITSPSLGSKITVNSKDWKFGTDGSLTLPSAGKIVNNNKEWLFNDTDGTLSSKMFLANAGSYGTTGYSFTGDGGLDTGMFSAGDGQIQFYSNTVKVAEITGGNITLLGHPTVEGVTSTGATGTGKLVFDNAPTFSGAVTVSNNTQSTSSTTGALIIAGGVGITRSLYVDGPVTTSTLTVKDVRDTVYSATFASTFTPDAANGAIQNLTLTGSITINAFASPQTGQTVTLILTQGGSGSYALTSTMKFAGGLKTLSTTVGSVDLLTITYTGSVYYASLVTGFV
jgi:autotransporter-associated beta strand protein